MTPRRAALASVAAVLLVTAGGVAAVAHAAPTTQTAAVAPTCTYPTSSSISNRQALTYNACRFDRVEALVSAPAATVTSTVTATATATVTETVTASPSGSTTPTPTPSPTPSPTPTAPPGSYTCGPVPLGDGCPNVAGPQGQSGYDAPGFSSNSNGWNTYVTNQDFGVQGTQSLWANGPGDWKVVSTMTDDGGRVQTFPNAQQLYDTCGGCDGLFPLSRFPELKVTYNETSPGGSGNHYQFSPDVFFSNYPNDVMFWSDINGRCNAGAWGPSLLGHFTMPDGAGWTAHRYDGSSTTTGNTGAEIILVKDGAGGQGTCAQDSAGVIDIKAGLAWLSSHGFMPADPTLAILQTGWEITQASNGAFTVNSMSYTDTFN